MAGKILGIDYGTKRIGLAISDETRTLARELRIVSPKEFWNSIAHSIREEEVGEIALGWPLNMSGGKTQKTGEVEAFKGQLEERLHLPIHLVDERLTTSYARNVSRPGERVDSLAAQLILQTYLDRSMNVS